MAPHQPRPASDAAHALERGGLAASQGRVQAGARAEESDPARGVVQRGGSTEDCRVKISKELRRKLMVLARIELVDEPRPRSRSAEELERAATMQ